MVLTCGCTDQHRASLSSARKSVKTEQQTNDGKALQASFTLTPPQQPQQLHTLSVEQQVTLAVLQSSTGPAQQHQQSLRLKSAHD